jgi:hypothetical protein
MGYTVILVTAVMLSVLSGSTTCSRVDQQEDQVLDDALSPAFDRCPKQGEVVYGNSQLINAVSTLELATVVQPLRAQRLTS